MHLKRKASQDLIQDAILGYLNRNRHKFDEHGHLDPTWDYRDFDASMPTSYRAPPPRGKIGLDARCKQVKMDCIAKCSDTALPTYTLNGDPFFNCVNRCMEKAGC